jgi:hypothetical protein
MTVSIHHPDIRPPEPERPVLADRVDHGGQLRCCSNFADRMRPSRSTIGLALIDPKPTSAPPGAVTQINVDNQ